jgi:hypothetical protein
MKATRNRIVHCNRPDTPPAGEVNPPTTTYHKQLAQTMAQLLGFDFKANAGHEVGDRLDLMQITQL